MGTPGGRFTTTLLLTAVTATLAGCDREVTGPGLMGAAAPHAQIGVAAAPSNDDFDDAVVVTSLPFQSILDTREATNAADDPACVGLGPTVWYAFTPGQSGFYEANTFGSDYDTTLGAYLGTRGNLSEIACNDDSAATLTSRVVVELEAGETVYFMVGAFSEGEVGTLVFNLLPSGPPPPPLEVGVSINPVGYFDPHTGAGTLRGTLTCSRPTLVDLFGVLEDRIGRIRVEAPFEAFLECDGSTPWEVQVIAENAFLVGGPTHVYVIALFFDPNNGEFAFAEDEATVKLRGGNGARGGRPAAGGRGARAARVPTAFAPLQQVMRKMQVTR